jgi:hypothetical protein
MAMVAAALPSPGIRADYWSLDLIGSHLRSVSPRCRALFLMVPHTARWTRATTEGDRAWSRASTCDPGAGDDRAVECPNPETVLFQNIVGLRPRSHPQSAKRDPCFPGSGAFRARLRACTGAREGGVKGGLRKIADTQLAGDLSHGTGRNASNSSSQSEAR